VVGGCDSRDVEMVMIGGVIRKWDGQLVDVDMSSLRTQAEASRERLYKRGNMTPNLFTNPSVNMEGRDFQGHGAAAVR
jgi:hypothetical protein